MRIDSESAIKNAVRRIGGVVSDDTPSKGEGQNADFIFRDSGIVAELKCIETDYMQSKEFQKKLDSFLEEMIEKGVIRPFFGKSTLKIHEFPVEHQNEFFDIIKGPINNRLKGANRQIKAIKEKLSYPTKGLIILVNDWAYGFDGTLALEVINRCMMASFSEVEAVLYISMNVLVELDSGKQGITWQVIYRSKENQIDPEFFKKLFYALQEELFDKYQIPKETVYLDHTSEPRNSPKPIWMTPKTVLQPGKFYKNPRGQFYFCIKVGGRVADLLVFNGVINGKIVAAQFSQEIENTGEYVEVIDPETLERLKLQKAAIKKLNPESGF